MNKPENVVLLCLHGSHLYGTDTPNSDKDYKGIYQAGLESIVHKEDKETIIYNSKPVSDRTRNTKDDVDIQYKELRRFIHDAMDGQIYAIDLLFAPEQFWIEYNGIWQCIINARHKLLSSNVKPFIGYCRQQAGRYGLKGSRLGEVIRFRDWLGTRYNSIKVGDVFHEFEQSEFVKLVTKTDKSGNAVQYIQVLEKCFQLNQKCGALGYSLTLWIDKYGTRSKAAMNNEGVDFKAVSHAFRCIRQVSELLRYGGILLPLADAEFIKAVKRGDYDYPTLQQMLVEEMEAVEQIESVLPEEPDRSYWRDFIESVYL